MESILFNINKATSTSFSYVLHSIYIFIHLPQPVSVFICKVLLLTIVQSCLLCFYFTHSKNICLLNGALTLLIFRCIAYIHFLAFPSVFLFVNVVPFQVSHSLLDFLKNSCKLPLDFKLHIFALFY